jgi:hypothetical protein
LEALIDARQFVDSSLASVPIVVSSVATTRADVTIYLSDADLGDGAPPSNMSVDFGHIGSIGDSGSFNIWVQTDVHVAAVNLDLVANGPAIRITSVDVQNYQTGATPRWNATTDGTVAGDGLTVHGIDGFALVGLGATGANPAVPDNGYDPVTGAFHFATVNYVAVAEGVTQFKLYIGANEVAFLEPTCLRFGFGDVCTPHGGIIVPEHEWNPLPDGVIFVPFVPEPTGLSLASLAAMGILGMVRRRHGRVSVAPRK